MREALQLLSKLTHQDLAWRSVTRHKRRVIANARTILEGQYPDALYFVLHGLLGIRAEVLGNATPEAL